MPTVVVARLTPVPEHREELIRILQETIAQVHQEPGCDLYALHSEPDTGHLVMVERWADMSALHAHLAGEPFRALGTRIGPLCAAPTELHLLEPLPAGRAEQGAV